MLKKIQVFFNKLIESGIDERMPFALENRVVLTNKITLVVVTAAILYLVSFIVLIKSFYLSLILLIFTLMFASPLLFNHLKHYNFARLMLIISGNLSTAAHALVAGEAAGFQLILFPAAMAPLFLFEMKQKKYILFGVSLSVACIAFLEIIDYQFFYQIELLPEIVTYLNYTFKALTVFLLLVWLHFLYVYFAQTQKKIKESYEAELKSRNYAEKMSHQSAYANLTQRIAHELRNPLTIIKVGIEMAFKTDTDRKKIEEISSMVKENIQRLLKLTDIMLKYGDENNEQQSSFDINEIIRDVVDIARSKCEDKKIKLISELLAKGKVFGYKHQLYQVILNVIYNCMEAIGQDGAITISTSEVNQEQTEKSSGVNIAIHDNGCGIEKKDLGKIFNPFFTKKDKKIGLGLSMVYRVVNNHKGKINVSSELNKGTVFEILLPYKENK
ncbi:sensor histidine kinase [Candidatus Margulisiibacteriota bacterium]